MDSYWKKIKLDLCLKPYRRINSTCIRDLNVKYETQQVLEETTGEFLFNESKEKGFLAMI